jgi:hypothetical protein
MPGIIDFTFNANKKLDADSFTTIRLRNDFKYKPGAEFYVNLRQERRTINRGLVRVVEVRHIFLNQINNFIAYLDEGVNQVECKQRIENRYKNVQPPINWNTQELSFVLLAKIKK